MRSLVAVSCILLSAGVLAADPPPAPDSAASAPQLQLSQPVCARGIFGFHFKINRASEGNIYIPLQEIARVCREGADDDDKPQSQRGHESLPQADRV